MIKTPRRWTADEDIALLAAVSKSCGKNEVKDWTSVAKALPGRTNKDCRKRWTNHLIGGLKKGSWDADEDDRLRCAVEEYGDQWTLVAEDVGGRSADQCAKRWQHSVNPSLDQSQWTGDEEQLLLEAVRKHGRAWKQIQKQYFSDRATNNVKNRYVTVTRRRGALNNAATSRTSQPEITLDAGDEMEGLELPSDYDSSSSEPSTLAMPSGQGYTAMQDENSHQHLTDLAPTSLFGHVSKLLPEQPLLTRPDGEVSASNDTSYPNLLDFVPDSYFEISSAPSGLQTPMTTPFDGQFDSLKPQQTYGDFDNQPLCLNTMSSATDSIPDPQSTMFTLTLDNPKPEIMVGVMSFLAHSKIKFKLENN